MAIFLAQIFTVSFQKTSYNQTTIDCLYQTTTSWSVKDINKFMQHPLIHSLMTYDTQYNNREIEYIDHNYSSDASSL